MDCPRDQTEMKHQGFWKYPRHACVQCGGLFVAERDLTENLGQPSHQRLENMAQIKLDNVSDSDLLCPKDSATMKAITFLDAEIEVCPSCHGLWLDKGEYEKIVAKMQRQVDAIRRNPKQPEPDLGEAPSAPPDEDAFYVIGQALRTLRRLRRWF